MFFKPRIFISSTLKQHLSIRSKIESFFESVGAEPMLYEKNLTPSINPTTYRQDILDADFVIFVLGKDYGTKTDTGKSGTHEEWEITESSKTPKHVYIKKLTDKEGEQEESQKEFIEKNIESNYISYSYYENEDDLLKQIKHTTFKIAREISLRKINEEKLDEKIVRMFAVNHDYNEGIRFIKGMEEIRRLNRTSIGFTDYIRTDILSSYISPWADYFEYKHYLFIDNKANELFSVLLREFERFTSIHLIEFTSYSYEKVSLKNIDYELNVARLNGGDYDTHEQLNEILKEFFASYKLFKEHILKIKSDFEIYF